MEKYYIIYNPHSKGGQAKFEAECLDVVNHLGNTETMDITKIYDYQNFFDSLEENDGIVLCGGDGTLNRFINDTQNIIIKNKIFYFPVETGNDFYRDITGNETGNIIEITPFEILTGKEIKVIYYEPRPLQIDGETIIDVSEYTAIIDRGLIL